VLTVLSTAEMANKKAATGPSSAPEQLWNIRTKIVSVDRAIQQDQARERPASAPHAVS